MPVSHLRICEPCNERIRYAPCSQSCRVGVDSDPESWRQNMQEGAGTMQAGDTL